jgi:hypothetical protein
MKYHEYIISKESVKHRSFKAEDFFEFRGVGIVFKTDKFSCNCLSTIHVFHGAIFKYKFFSFRELSDFDLNKLINKCWGSRR